MSFLQTLLTSPRRTFPQSSSTQTWQDRIGDLALVAGISSAAASCLLLDLTWWQAMLVCALSLLPSVPLLWTGWLKLFGPVLRYDMVRQARRGRLVLIRLLYMLVLAGWMFRMLVAATDGRLFVNDARQGAILARGCFEVFMVIQLIAVVFLTPVFVGGAIAEEKDRRTLEFMLTTDLKNREIVLGKFCSRLAALALLVLAGLPMLSILQFLGGVDPNLVLVGFAVSSVTMVSLAAVSILCSVVCKKARDAIVLAYLVIGMSYGLSLIVAMRVTLGRAVWNEIANTRIWFGSDPLVLADVIRVLDKGNLVTLLSAVEEAGARGTLAIWLPILLRDYALFHGWVVLGCLALAVAGVRRVALAQSCGRTIKTPRPGLVGTRLHIGSQAMLWKEMNYRGRVSSRRVGLLVMGLLAAAIFWRVVWNFIVSWRHTYPPIIYGAVREDLSAWVRGATVVVGCLTVLAVGVHASTTVTRERDRQTLDTLLTTPLSSASILYGKWLGSLLSQRLGMLLLAMIWSAGIATGALSISALPLLVYAWLIYAALGASFGLLFSTVSRSSLRATFFTIMTLAAIGTGQWMLWPDRQTLGESPGTSELLHTAQAALLTPPFILWLFAYHDGPTTHFNPGPGYVHISVASLLIWAAVAFALYCIAIKRFRKYCRHDARQLHPD